MEHNNAVASWLPWRCWSHRAGGYTRHIYTRSVGAPVFNTQRGGEFYTFAHTSHVAPCPPTRGALRKPTEGILLRPRYVRDSYLSCVYWLWLTHQSQRAKGIMCMLCEIHSSAVSGVCVCFRTGYTYMAVPEREHDDSAQEGIDRTIATSTMAMV